MEENKLFENLKIDLTNFPKNFIEENAFNINSLKDSLNLSVVKPELFNELSSLANSSLTSITNNVFDDLYRLKLDIINEKPLINISDIFDIEYLTTIQEELSKLCTSSFESIISNANTLIDLNVSEQIHSMYENLNAYIIENDLESPYEVPEIEEHSNPLSLKNTHTIVMYIFQVLIWIYGLITAHDQKEFIIQNIISIQLQLAVILENKINSNTDENNHQK